jgi:hypothetical protein
MAVILLALLASASGNTRLFEGRYPLLLGLAGGVALMLLVLVLELLRRLVTRYRRGLFGTRLMAHGRFLRADDGGAGRTGVFRGGAIRWPVDRVLVRRRWSGRSNPD